MKLVRMSPGHGDVLLAEGDPRSEEDIERLVEEFRRQLDLGMWAAVPTPGDVGRREATMVREFSEVPLDAEKVIFFPQAAGGATGLPQAEVRARELLREAAGIEVAEMYEQLGFVGVEPLGGRGDYGYVIYPHRPIVAYDAHTGELLSEYCVRFPDTSLSDGDEGRAREWLPDADDVLAKWMVLRADERRLIGDANLDLPGRQLDPGMVRRDIETLERWRRDH